MYYEEDEYQEEETFEPEDDYSDYNDNFECHYDDFGGYMGYNDEAIYDAFEGDPENVWNVE
jgi:hypothetical protein